MLHQSLILLLNKSEEQYSNMDDFLHPGEKKLLERVIEFSADYHWIVAFCNTVLKNDQSDLEVSCQSGEADESVTTPLQGFYIKAFANGVLHALDDYKKEIKALQNKTLQNPQLPITFVLSCLEKYKDLFKELKEMINLVQCDNLRGCLLMGKMKKHIFEANELGRAAEIISKSISNVFYRHLCNWIIYGNLVDDYNEFFIRDGKCADEDFLYPEQLEETSLGKATSDSNSSVESRHNKSSRMRRPPLVQKFFINWDMVPLVISEDTAESILFMGRIVWIVTNNPKRLSDDSCDIWDGQNMEYFKKLQSLGDEIFDQSKFEKTIEECRMKLTKFLWSIMLEEGNLKEHLQLLRDYYALGRGELFHQFIAIVENHMKSSELNSHNLNFIFLDTARKIYGDNDKSYLRFELSLPKADFLAMDPWTRLQMNFEIRWPLHIIFYPKSMELYNKLFTYLLSLSRTQIKLHKLWQLHHTCVTKNVDRRVWSLRQRLMFLVNNLQYYLQVDVIEAHFSMLLKAVENASEFEDIIKVHHQFISDLLAKTFVLTAEESHTYENKHRLHHTPAVKFNQPSKVYNVIVQTLELCDKFCIVATMWDVVLLEPEVVELEKFQKDTDIIVRALLHTLYSLHGRARGQHLLQLLHQLDFNKFFSTEMAELNL